MNLYFLAAGILTFLVGLVHSVLGERMIFRRMRQQDIIPTHGGDVLREGHVRIMWASWHLVSLMGWGLAAMLMWLAFSPLAQATRNAIATMTMAAMLASSALVLLATKGRHPGWVGLLGVAVLLLIGMA
jgi:hypothetical protein